jgi:hypothetical protein
LVNSVYLSTREAAVRLSIGASTLKKLRVTGGGPALHRIGRRVVYSSEIRMGKASNIRKHQRVSPGMLT